MKSYVDAPSMVGLLGNDSREACWYCQHLVLIGDLGPLCHFLLSSWPL